MSMRAMSAGNWNSAGVIAAVGATSVKDMGKVMAELKAKYSGQIDMGKAGGVVKSLLG